MNIWQVRFYSVRWFWYILEFLGLPCAPVGQSSKSFNMHCDYYRQGQADALSVSTLMPLVTIGFSLREILEHIKVIANLQCGLMTSWSTKNTKISPPHTNDLAPNAKTGLAWLTPETYYQVFSGLGSVLKRNGMLLAKPWTRSCEALHAALYWMQYLSYIRVRYYWSTLRNCSCIICERVYLAPLKWSTCYNKTWAHGCWKKGILHRSPCANPPTYGRIHFLNRPEVESLKDIQTLWLAHDISATCSMNEWTRCLRRNYCVLVWKYTFFLIFLSYSSR